MVKLLRILFPFLLSGCLSCTEVPPTITLAGENPSNTNTPVAEQERQVLIEEFSGVKCVNCPAGSEAIEVLSSIYGERLVPVSIHAGFFASPYPESQYDFQTEDGDNLLNYLSSPLGFPTAVINRTKFPGEEGLQLNQNKWAGFIADELEQAPAVKIDLNKEFRINERSLEIEVTLYIQENITAEDIRLSVLITEDNIRDFQLTPQGKIGNYKHRHVLREILTDFNGMRLTEDLIAGEQIKKEFSFSLPNAWQAENCSIVAFVNLNGTQKKVLQVHEVNMMD